MPNQAKTRRMNGGHAVVDCLRNEGVRHDSTPLVLLVGQVARALRGREAGQEIDYTHFFGSLAKWVIEVMTELEFISPTAELSQVTAGQPGR